MKHSILALASLVLLAGCVRYDVPVPVDEYTAPSVPSEPEPASSSAATEEVQFQEVVLVDQGYAQVGDARGRDWLKAIGVKKISGHADQAYLNVEIERGDRDDGWAGVGMYYAPSFKDQIDTTRQWTRLRYIAADWKGNCGRHLAPSTSFGVIQGVSAQTTQNLTSVEVTNEDPCVAGRQTVNLLHDLNRTGAIYLGFMPSDPTYRVRVTLYFRGDLTVSAF